MAAYRAALLTLIICIIGLTVIPLISLNHCPPPPICSAIEDTIVASSAIEEDHQESVHCQNAVPKSFEGFDNERGHPDGCYIAPNYVHFLRFGPKEIGFVDAVCILAALKHQKPERLYIHTNNLNFTGRYWEMLKREPGFLEVLHIVKTEVPRSIFGQKINPGWLFYHAGDVTRLKILMKYGGIFLDNDSYIVRPLEDLRRYEIAIGWMENDSLSNQAIIAHRRARFLSLWLETYRNAYNGSSWFYNAAHKPTAEILVPNPHLIHREKLLLAHSYVMAELYLKNWPEWRTHYVIHLLSNHQYLLVNRSEFLTYPVVWNEEVIQNYPVTFRDMVYDVWPYKPHRVPTT